jgi:glycosyltransferase involved in cell wall biosynthesis
MRSWPTISICSSGLVEAPPQFRGRAALAKKILHMHFGKDGGAERFFVNLVQAFGERGLEQRFVIRPERAWRAEVARLGPVIESNYRPYLPSGWLLTWRVRQLVGKWKPDVIMAWMSRASRLIPHYDPAVKVTRLGDVPRHLKPFRRDDCIVSNAPAVLDRCVDLGWKRPIKLISNFPREVAPVPVSRAQMNTPEQAFIICGTGRFTGRKAFDVLVRAAAKVEGAWLWLIGDGYDRAKLEALAAELGIAERTRFTGWLNEPMHYIAACDVTVVPSRYEPLGNVILESWHAGVPPVATRSEGPRWFVEDGKDGLLCDIDDVDGMAAAIVRTRDDPALRARLVASGRMKLAAQFTKERVIGQYLAVFDRDF